MKLLKESKTLSEKGKKALKESIWRTDPDTENIKHLTDEQINKLYDEITIEQDERISDAYVKDEILHVIIEDSEGITTDYMPNFEKDQLDRVMGKDMTESLNEDVNTNDLAKFIEKAVNDLKNGGEGTWYKRLGYTINDTELYLVIGLVSGKQFDSEDLEYYSTDDTGKYIICGKIAVNDSAMQSDYELDWLMPYNEDSGDVWDTDSSFSANPDYTQEAKDFINEFNIMKNFNITDEGVIIEDDKSVEENLEERNLTRSERYNRDMNKIFDDYRKENEQIAKFLLDKGVNPEEVEELKKNTGLGKNALDDKLLELGIRDEY